jgi:hypothetical protein
VKGLAASEEHMLNEEGVSISTSTDCQHRLRPRKNRRESGFQWCNFESISWIIILRCICMIVLTWFLILV